MFRNGSIHCTFFESEKRSNISNDDQQRKKTERRRKKTVELRKASNLVVSFKWTLATGNNTIMKVYRLHISFCSLFTFSVFFLMFISILFRSFKWRRIKSFRSICFKDNSSWFDLIFLHIRRKHWILPEKELNANLNSFL